MKYIPCVVSIVLPFVCVANIRMGLPGLPPYLRPREHHGNAAFDPPARVQKSKPNEKPSERSQKPRSSELPEIIPRPPKRE